MDDSMPIDDKKKEETIEKKPDDFMSIMLDIFGHVNFKLVFILFLIFLFITSDVFIDMFLGEIKGAVDYNHPTTYGTVVQGILLVLFYAIFDILIKTKML